MYYSSTNEEHPQSPPVGVFLGRYFLSSVLISLFWTFPLCPITPQIPTQCAIIGLKNGRGLVRNRMFYYKYKHKHSTGTWIRKMFRLNGTLFPIFFKVI